MKIRKIEFDTEEEMERVINKGNYKFYKFIVDSALKNLKSKKKEITIMSILTKDTNITFDIILEPKYIVETLETNLRVMEDFEDYESCQKIVDAINYLQNK